MTGQNAVNMETLWTIRTEQFKERSFIGLQNPLPQSYEDEQRLFATLAARRNEIMGQTLDGNTYMVIHDNGSKMTVGLMVTQLGEIPDGMVSLNLPDEEYVVFRFEEKHICSFWQFFCDRENQKKYELDVVKARFETFNDSLQPNGITEIYFPKASHAYVKA
ncbi:GyrI-like domain-containing protein [Gordoniibacillus kamchatkensis]|uniref:GyrI-like domain-containing protein n=1 Tax=Gordoniibacillus kamchatkensis TaxID=1590651 RepID=UPI0009E2D630|nr:GyrI-like domain-containing protein [Paenibacillus sp. VKM B-2647]